jgi:hypothetical protein
MPSAADGKPPRLPRSWRARLRRGVLFAVLGVLLLIVLAGVALYTVGVDAIGNQRLRQQADLVLTRVAGVDVDVSLGELQLGLGTNSLFALDVRDARITREEDGMPIARAGVLRFGIRAIPLLWGKLELSQITLEDADLFAPAIQPLLGERQLGGALSPDQVQEAVFGLVRNLYSSGGNAGLTRLSFDNVALLGADDEHLLNLENMELRLSGENALLLEGAASFAGNVLEFTGTTEHAPGSGTVSNLSLDVALHGSVNNANETGPLRRLGGVEVSLQGNETDSEGAWLLLDAKLTDLLMASRKDELEIDTATLRVGMNAGAPGFSILQSSIAAGSNRINFEGIVSPDPDDPEGYRFDLATRDSHLAPEGSVEEPLSFASRAIGSIEPRHNRLSAERIDLRTDSGTVSAVGEATFVAGRAPGIKLALDVAEIPTVQAKQLWPWFAATGARKWVMENLSGGTVSDSSLSLNIPPGRLGNGVPLSKDEVSGQFNVKGAHFNLVGDLPAVSESDGWVEFDGTDVFVGLTSGTARLASGRIVRTGGGTMEITAAHRRPRIGKLGIDISGEAPAVAEFASLKPINASFLDLKPSDLSGNVTGHINADIPLHEGIPAESLGWNVELAFEDLALAKPLEGQEIRSATGTMLLDRRRAEIVGTAELNGVPAELELLEPLGRSDVVRRRKIELEVSNDDRERLFPGLGSLVSGPMHVTYEQGSGVDRDISVDLTTARLSVPWIGWQKGSGIPAAASFVMRESDGQTELSNFKLTGETFGLTGQIVLAKGQLRQARFSEVRFNRGDQLAADINANGSGFDVVVRGEAFDARSIIKLVTGKEEKPAEGGEEDSSPITVKANIGTLTGFHDVKLTQAVVEYAAGNGPDRLTIRAATPNYGSVAFERRTERGQRLLRLASQNGGEVLRFLDFYRYMEGGVLNLSLSGPNDNALTGRVTIQDFWVVNEPRLRSLVAASTESRARGEVVDVTRVQFGSAAADLGKGRQRVDLANGVIRGPAIGLAFQGTLFDAQNNTNMTGTFMPIYGLNRIFGEIPIIGQILGNGRDRGLIGITFRVVGPFDQPTLEVNPMSAIAPGIFRQIFEFN